MALTLDSVTRFGGDVRLRWKTVSMDTSVKVRMTGVLMITIGTTT